MGSQRSPQSSQYSSAKKQQSISSFFSATQVRNASTNGNHHPHGQSGLGSRAEDKDADELFITKDVEPSDLEVEDSTRSKRSLDSDEESLPSAKKLKESIGNHVHDSTAPEPRPISETHSRPLLEPISGNAASGTTSNRATGRASKYTFSSSPSQQENRANESEDEQSRKTKERLHQKFVKKLGRPDSIAEIKRRNHFISEETQEEEAGEDGDDADEEPEPAPPKPKGRRLPAKKGRDKLTPLEKQVLDIKRSHSDTVLVVEVGYKFRFFGEDARVAARELSIVCIPGKFRFDEHPSEAHLDRFASASIPVHRLHVHVKRLVSTGHKVGVVRQLETAALKAAGDTRNKAFERGLTNLYTKGTYIDDQEGLDAPIAAPNGGASATGHLLCLTETRPRGWGSDEKVQIGLVAVQPATGDIIYDDFEDGWMRSELETRLLHIAPCEFLIVGEVSKATDKLVHHLSGSKTNVFGDKARVERVDKPKTMAAQAYSHITSFYAEKLSGDSSEVESSQDTGTLLGKVHKLSENATICLSAMITHLTDYGLQHVFDLTRYFQSFSARSHMLLNGNTLTSLEIYHNQTDNAEHGSLFWTMDRTRTRFGRRLLRKWVGRPLLDRRQLSARVAAVQELKENGHSAAVERIRRLVGKVKSDLEKSLIRIYYRKCTRPELLGVLQTLQTIAQEYAHVKNMEDAGFQSEMINEAISDLPKMSEDLVEYLERINAQAAKEDDKYNFFREDQETDDIQNYRGGIVIVEHELDDFKTVAAEKLKRKRVDYVTVAGIEYLIELNNDNLRNLPASWAKISGTKKVSRYHAPEVVRMMRERDQHKEALANACDAAFDNLLEAIGSKYQIFRDCVQSLALLDCLLSLAEIASQPGYCKPDFTDEIGIDIEAGRHPMVEQLLLDAFVPNDVHLATGDTRALLVTGPNMGGKSSYVRSVALIVIMAQVGSYVPADSARLGLLDAVFTRMGAFDNMMKGESTFMVELSETSDILKQATPRSLVILDELGRGTSTHDGVAIAQAVLHYAVATLRSLTLFITHYQSLSRTADQLDGALKNVHMRFTEDEDEAGEKNVTFLYEIGEGMAHRSYGLNVAKLAGLPKGLIDEASRRSQHMEERENRRRVGYLAKVLGSLVRESDPGDLEHLVAGIEQM